MTQVESLKLAHKMKKKKSFYEMKYKVCLLKTSCHCNLGNKAGSLLTEVVAKHEHSLSVLSIKYWNSLPERVKMIDSLKLFCTRVKQEMMQNKLNFPE